MGREVKREPTVSSLALEPRADRKEARDASSTWFPARAPFTPAPAEAPPEARPWLRFVPLVGLLAIGVALMAGVGAVPLAPFAVGLGALSLFLRTRGSRPLSPRRAAEEDGGRGLLLDARALSFVAESGEAAEVVVTSAPFGLTLVTSRHRDRLVAAVSSSSGVFYVGASFDPGSRRAVASLLGKASAVATDEAGLEAIAPDGEPMELSTDDFSTLVRALSSRDPSCLERVFLSDARGAPFAIDAQHLSAAGHVFELSSPLDWRAFVFQEAFGAAVAVYQATWIKQGSSEVVLVSLLPSLSPPRDLTVTGIAEIDRAVIRDLRLLQAPPGDPPPNDRRVAIDRLFMLPVRAALDSAPRPSRQPAEARA